MTISDWQKKGFKEISRDVDYLLSGILGLSRAELYLNSSREVDEKKGRELSSALEKRLSGTPLQYILGEVEFFSLPFYVRPGVFIPRPETELLVEQALSLQRGLSAKIGTVPGEILDLCTGCGNIALSFAKNSSCKVIATDISGHSLKIAKENAVRLSLSDRVEFLQGDLFNPLSSLFRYFSLIISNPPYISSKEWDSLPEEVKCHEPHEALFAGVDGLDFYKRISKDAKNFIKPDGHLFLEVGPAAEVASILREDGWQDIRITKDYNNLDRIISCLWLE